MKKLFVMFLLVALVPFTIGCGLFGDNEDTTPVNLPILRASVSGLTPPPSIRGAVVNLFAGYKLLVDGNELAADGEFDLGNGTYKVDFKAFVTAAIINAIAAKTELVPVVLVVPATATTPASTQTIYVPMASLTSGDSIAITIPAAGGVPTVTVGGESVPVVEEVANIVNITGVTNNGVAVATTQAAAVAVNSLTPAFVVTLDADVVLPATSYSVVVKNVNGTSRALTGSDITVTAVQGNTKQVNVAVNQALSAGQTYMVKVEYIEGSNGKVVSPKTFYIKTAQ